MPAPLNSRWRTYGLPALLFLASVVTTTAIGARFMQNFLDGLPMIAREADLWPWPWLFAQPSRFLLGAPFSAALLSILLVHEFGHYFACRAHGIRCTLPWVLPAPTLSGTAGAVLLIRGSIPNRRALMDVGAYGPIAGYLASLIAAIAGFLLSQRAPGRSAIFDPGHPIIGFGQPLTFQAVHWLLAQIRPDIPTFEHGLRHPVLIAAWIGLFITSLNLIPGGQLDGGHILYALSPRLHKIATRLLPIALLLCGLFFWLGWILWGSILLLPSMRHPRVPLHGPLDLKRRLLVLLTLAIFALTVSAQPFVGASIMHYFNSR